MLTVDKLTDYIAVCRLLSILNDKLKTGRADDVDDVRETLSELCHRLEPELPIIRGIIAAHRQARDAFQLAQRPAGGQPAPYPYPANDTHSVTPTAPSLA
jgi:hypothetical protein